MSRQQERRSKRVLSNIQKRAARRSGTVELDSEAQNIFDNLSSGGVSTPSESLIEGDQSIQFNGGEKATTEVRSFGEDVADNPFKRFFS